MYEKENYFLGKYYVFTVHFDQGGIGFCTQCINNEVQAR